MVIENVRIHQKENGFTTVKIGEKEIKCAGYTILQDPNELSEINLSVVAIPDVEGAMIIKVSNKEEIARLMDEEEFIDFCDIWRDIWGKQLIGGSREKKKI